jgi:O-antigen ligase
VSTPVSTTRPIRLAIWRGGLAGLRLLLLYFIGCFVLYELAAEWQTLRTAEQQLRNPPAALSTSAGQLPFLGINIDLFAQPADEQHTTLQRLRHQGFGWVRQRFDWGQLEPKPGQFAWSESDQLLAAITQSDLIPIIVLDGSPSWARAERDQANPLAPPADPTDFARFAAAFANRYGQQVRYYQLWDEPNIAPHWGDRHIEPLDYAQLLKLASPAIRQQDPDAIILLAALAPTADRGHTAIDEVYFLQRLYATGAAAHFDAVAVQVFGFGYSPDHAHVRLNLLNFQRLRLVRQTMIAAGDGETPLWAVRFGWNRQAGTPWPTISAAEQGQFAARAIEIGYIEWPWLVAMGWALDQPATPDDPQRGFALTPELTTALTTAMDLNQPRPTAELESRPAWRWWVGLALLFILGWRGWAAARCIPWATWLDRQRRWPWWGQLGCWLLLGGSYYLLTWPPATGLTLLGALFLVTANPSHGVIGAVLTLPFYFQHKEFGVAGLTSTWPPAQSFCLALLPTVINCGWTWWQQSSRRSWQHLDRLALGWLVLSLLSMINVWQWAAFGRGLLEAVLMPLLLYVALRQVASEHKQLRRFIIALAISGSLVALIGLMHWLAGGGTEADGVRRLVGPYFSPNHAALYLVRILPITAVLWIVQPTRRWLWTLVALLLGVALLLTASRGAWLLGVPAAGLLLGRFWLQTRSWRTFQPWLTPNWLILPLLGLLGGSLALAWPRLTNSASLLNRLAIWQNTLQLWADFPWVGTGPGAFFWRYPAYVQPGDEFNLLHPHNLWLEIASTWGALGLLWFLVMLLVTSKLFQQLWANLNEPGWFAVGLGAGLLAAFAHAQVDAFWTLPDLAMWNWLALALLVNLAQTDQ